MRLDPRLLGLGGGRGLGLGPEDPCYDPDHPWYLPNWYNDSVECACMAEAGTSVYPLGQQCATVTGVAQTMGAQAGAVVGSATTVAGGAIGGAVAGVGEGVASSAGLPGAIVIA